MMRDLTGLQVGRMTVLGPAGPQDGLLPETPGGWWTARCACGREITAPSEAFTARRITSCGRPSPEDRVAEAERLGAHQPPPRI